MSSFRPIVNSWDVFDTLLTRFVPEPMQVFDLIEKRAPGFKALRLGAQMALDKLGKPYVIYDIYAKMRELGLESAMSRALLREELAVERSLMLPIRRAVRQVAPSDLIISDMYLSGEIIQALLAEVCGLHGQYPIVRSNWGKHSGTIWPKLLERYVIRTHYGDNPAADGEIPRAFGIDTGLCRDIDPTPWEAGLREAGLIQLSLLQREARLRTLPEPAGPFETLACGPYLTLLAALAARLVEEFGEDAHFVFLSRDGDDFGAVFRALFPAVSCANADVSRRLARDAEMGPVFAEILKPGCVLVDGVSTGRSLRALLERIGTQDRRFAVLLFLDTLLSAEDQAAFTGTALFRASEFGGHHHALELLLQSPYPPVMGLGFDAASGGLVRRFGHAELAGDEAARIGTKTELVSAFCRAILLRGLTPLTSAQTGLLLKSSLAAILGSGLPPALFPSFIAREKFAPF
jgi:hypothetical protein